MRATAVSPLAALALWVATSGAATSPLTPAAFGALSWRSIGPYRGGRVLAVTGVQDDRLHFYFGAVNGGVWETRDAGRTWSAISDVLPVGAIGALAVAPSDAKLLYAGTGEADMRSDIAQGLGMFKSTDGGRSWIYSGLGESQAIAKILVDPKAPDTVLVAALGHPYGPNPQRGVFRSADGGRTWTRTLFRDENTGAIDLAYKPGDPSVAYAALWRTRRPPWNAYGPSSGPGGGVFKSEDGGVSWTELSGRGLPDSPGRIGLAVAPGAPHRLFVLVDAKEGGLWRSDDDGASFHRISGDPRIWQRGWYFGGLTVDPSNADRLWVCNTILLASTDGGRTFLPVKGDPTGDDFHILWIDPADPDRRILGVDQGTLVTLNGGKTWSSWFNQPTGQFYHVSTDSRFPYRVYGAQQDSGAAGVPSRTGSYDGIDMTVFHEIGAGGESDNIAPDPDHPDIVFGGRVDRLDLRSGQIRSVDPTLAYPGSYRGTWTLPLVFGTADHALYFANQRIFRTADGGARWRPISPDLSRPDPGVPENLDPPAAADLAPGAGARKGVVYSLGPSPLAAPDIWAGTDDGLVWRTSDGGSHWRDVTPPGVTPWSKVATVEPSHFSRQTAYVAIDRHRLDDFAPYIWRTRDGGRAWTSIVTGLAEGGTLNAVNVVKEDPVRPGLLYAGTERGAFVSLDDGGRWAPLARGLPVTSVRDITVHGDDLVIATHGRGFYILDDIEPLRELAANPAGGTRLFAPAPAIRARSFGFTGTPKPRDEPSAPNPPQGAYIDYSLQADARAPVALVISDAKGRTVRRYSSADVPPPLDLSRIESAPEWIDRPMPPSARAGQHRFVWDLRYEKPAVLAEGFRDTAVWAPPGSYRVSLTVDGETYRQPLEVRPDPRVKATAEDYRRAFELARAIEADRVRVRAALGGMQADLAGKAALGDISARLDSLAVAVDGADGAPSPDAEAGYALADRALAAAVGR